MNIKHITKIIGLLILLTFISACRQNNEAAMDLGDKKELLKTKKAALNSLEKEITILEEEILAMEPPKEKEAILVNFDTITPQLFQRYVTVQATVESDELVNVTTEMAGRINRLLVEEGQYVKKGQLIASVDMETLEKQIGEIETSLSLADDVYKRQKRLWDQEIGSEIQYLQAKNNKERLEKSLETLQSQLAKKNIYAPISGMVNKEYLSSGEVVSPGVPIIDILKTSTVRVVADIPESYLGDVKLGDYVDVYIPALDLNRKEKIDLIGSTIDPGNRTFRIEMRMSNNGGVLKPNLLAEVKFNDYTKNDALIAPVDFILEEVSGKKYIYKGVKEGEKYIARKSYITLGESYDGMVIIESGIQPGDIMITEGSRNINTNDPLTLANSK